MTFFAHTNARRSQSQSQNRHQSLFGVAVSKLLESTPMLQSRLSWRITSVVFLTFMIVQAGILNVTIGSVKSQELAQIEEIGKSAIQPIIDPQAFLTRSTPITDVQAQRIIRKTPIKGFRIVDNELSHVQSAGDTVLTKVTGFDSLKTTYNSPDGNSYEFIFADNKLAPNYYIAARLDSSEVQKNIYNYVVQSILIMLCLSGFVTAVLMVALGHWLLEPMLFMRANLREAAEHPENANIKPSPFKANDEIGSTILLTQELIHQNAENIANIKSKARDKIHKLAYYDTLTSLPNRAYFLEAIEKATKPSTDENHKALTPSFAIITVDLDHFKDINDSMGHNVGDAILRGVGERLRSALPASATVSRTGEDEFAILMPLSTSLNNTHDIATKIHEVVRGKPFIIFNESFQIRASIGAATFPDDGTDPETVLKNADIALNRAKEEGRDTIKEYSEDFNRDVQKRFQMLRNLRDALEHDKLSIHYQPQLNLKTGKVIGAEALIRWWQEDNSKEGGHYISPIEFIPIAEQSGLIVQIGQWIMEKACRTAQGWREEHGIDLRIAINVSPHQFTQSDVVAYTKDVIKSTGIEPKMLELEVTESVFMDDMDHTIQTLKELHELGVELAIDDFGTGYSSLSYLRLFPVDRLKIDQAFTRNALTNPDDASITRTIIALGHALGLSVIAEGVETIEHEEFLIKEGCDEVQGFRYARPLPTEEFVAFMINRGEASKHS